MWINVVKLSVCRLSHLNNVRPVTHDTGYTIGIIKVLIRTYAPEWSFDSDDFQYCSGHTYKYTTNSGANSGEVYRGGYLADDIQGRINYFLSYLSPTKYAGLNRSVLTC